MKLWCTNQMVDEDGSILCCAHLAESSVFNCPYKNNEKRLESQYPCSDYESVNVENMKNSEVKYGRQRSKVL